LDSIKGIFQLYFQEIWFGLNSIHSNQFSTLNEVDSFNQEETKFVIVINMSINRLLIQLNLMISSEV